MPRGLILPPDAPEEAQEWWIDTMKKVVETDGVAGSTSTRTTSSRTSAGARTSRRTSTRRSAEFEKQLDGARTRCDHDVTLRHEQQRAGRPAARRLGATPTVVLPAAAPGRARASTPRWPSTWSGGPPPAGSAPASSRGSSACLGLALTLVALVADAARARSDEDETVARRGRGRRGRPRPAPERCCVLVPGGRRRSCWRRCSRSARSSPRRRSCWPCCSLLNRGRHVTNVAAQRCCCPLGLYLLFQTLLNAGLPERHPAAGSDSIVRKHRTWTCSTTSARASWPS